MFCILKDFCEFKRISFSYSNAKIVKMAYNQKKPQHPRFELFAGHSTNELYSKPQTNELEITLNPKP